MNNIEKKKKPSATTDGRWQSATVDDSNGMWRERQLPRLDRWTGRMLRENEVSRWRRVDLRGGAEFAHPRVPAKHVPGTQLSYCTCIPDTWL